MNGRPRVRSIAGWAIGWAIAATAVFLAPAARMLGASEFVAAVLAIGGGAIGIGVGGYLAAAARAGTTAESRSPTAEAVVWAMAFAGAALFLLVQPTEEYGKPGEVNAVTLPPPGESYSNARSGIRFSPVQIHFFEAVPAFGAIGGFLAAAAGARRRSIIDAARAIGASALRTIAVIVAVVIAVLSVSILSAVFTPALGPLSPIVGIVVAVAISGAMAGSIFGAIGEPFGRPAGGPPDPEPATSA